MKQDAFKLVRKIAAGVKAALALPSHAERAEAMANIKPYRSRGKGRGGSMRAQSRTSTVARESRSAAKRLAVQREKRRQQG